MNNDRQKTISHGLVIESWRTRMPPVDQQVAATIMNRTARRCRAGCVDDEVLVIRKRIGCAATKRVAAISVMGG